MSRRSAADKKIDKIRDQLQTDIAICEKVIVEQQAGIDAARRMLAQLDEISTPKTGK